MIALIAAVYIGFAVSDGRSRVIAVEVAVVVAFFVAAAAAVSVTPWVLVAIYLAHGAKDLWQHRTSSSTGPGGGRRSASPSTWPSPGSSPPRSSSASTFHA